MPLKFNDLLAREAIDSAETAVILHTPREQKIRALMPLWATERPELLDTYQSTHSRNPEATLKKRRFAASFVNLMDRSFIFIGLFENFGGSFHSFAEIDSLSQFRSLYECTDATPFCDKDDGAVQGRVVFRLERMSDLSEFTGRLRVAAPDAPRPYIRKAENLDLSVLSLSEEGYGDRTVTDWRRLTLTKAEIDVLPSLWTATLSQWRGIYLIVDEKDGARYVGSAYGAENLLGRWREHIRKDRGVTVELRHRNTKTFRFSILQRVSPDMQVDEIVALENDWKLRLHTIEFGLNLA